MYNSLQPYGLQPDGLLCPCDFPGKNTGVGCHFLLQRIFPTQRLNSCLLWLLQWQMDSLLLTPQGSPFWILGLSLKKARGALTSERNSSCYPPPPAKRPSSQDEEWPAYNTTLQSYQGTEWICIVFRKVELIRLKEENETQVSYTIFTPIVAFSRNGEWARRLVIYISYFFLEILR